MVRPPAVSGTFYPADPRALRDEVERLLEGGRPAGGRGAGARGAGLASGSPSALTEVTALMAPHAGYVYSGRVAGLTFGSAGLPPRLIVLGPNHTGRGAPFAIYDSGEWETPLGRVPVDGELVRALIERCPLLEVDAEAHRREHSIEVELPFLQVLVPELRFVPICVGSHRLEELRALGAAIAALGKAIPERFALVISSDMTHYEPVEVAKKQDRKALAELERVDAEALHRVVAREKISMCGVYPAVAAMEACRGLGVREGTLVGYATSGDVTGDPSDVVAYAGMHFRRAA